MSTSNKHTISFETTPELQQAVALASADVIREAVNNRGIANVSLSGGSTPRRIYQLLAEQDLPWDQIHWFWGDERNVTSDSDQSNERMVRETLLSHQHTPESQIHPVTVDVDQPAIGAQAYEKILREHFLGNDTPQWDLVLLGLGDDAHTASLFPGTKALQEKDRWFVENWVEQMNTFRYTLTAPAINSGRNIWFLVAGEGKREALRNVWSEQHAPTEYPSQLICPTAWYITSDAKP